MTASRMHIATQWHLMGGGSVLRCKCGQWESDPTQSVRVQRAAHRAHRVDMGEQVAPVKPTLAERVAHVRALHQRTEDKDAAETLALAWCSRPVDGKPCEVCQPRAARLVEDLARRGMTVVEAELVEEVLFLLKGRETDVEARLRAAVERPGEAS